MSHKKKESDLKEDFVIKNDVLIKCTNKDLTTVLIPDSVKRIEHSAFEGCSNLNTIIISNSVTEIGGDAFNSCSSLVSVEIPDSVTEIGPGAFWGCSSIVSVKIPLGVTEIAPGTFWGCSSLVSVEIPNSIAEIGTSAFSRCSHLTSIVIPDSVTEIGEYAFSFCSRLTSVEIPDSVTKIGDYAFSGCSCLASIDIPSSVKRIGDYAFSDCSRLNSVEIPNNISEIGFNAFSGCSNVFKIHRITAKEKALQMLRKAAYLGNAEAQYKLGECYYYGVRLKKDYGEAIKWFRKAAEGEHDEAQYMLGECYYLGNGLKEDNAEAAKWFHNAATRGNAKAKYKLQKCYHINIGVEKKNVEEKKIRKNNTRKRVDEQANVFDEESEIELHDEIEELNAFEAEEDTLNSSNTKQANNKRSHSKDGFRTEEYDFNEDNIRAFQLHVELLEYDVSADIQVREDMTFEALHKFLNKIFERNGNMLYRFECDDGLIAVCDEEEAEDEEALSEDCLIGHHLSIGKGAYYIFDNGNEWNHRIIVKEVLVAEPKEQYPKAINMVIKIKGDIPEQFPLGLFQNRDRRLRRR